VEKLKHCASVSFYLLALGTAVNSCPL